MAGVFCIVVVVVRVVRSSVSSSSSVEDQGVQVDTSTKNKRENFACVGSPFEMVTSSLGVDAGHSGPEMGIAIAESRQTELTLRYQTQVLDVDLVLNYDEAAKLPSSRTR